MLNRSYRTKLSLSKTWSGSRKRCVGCFSLPAKIAANFRTHAPICQRAGWGYNRMGSLSCRHNSWPVLFRMKKPSFSEARLFSSFSALRKMDGSRTIIRRIFWSAPDPNGYCYAYYWIEGYSWNPELNYYGRACYISP